MQASERQEPRPAGKGMRKATVVSTTNINTEQYQTVRQTMLVANGGLSGKSLLSNLPRRRL